MFAVSAIAHQMSLCVTHIADTTPSISVFSSCQQKISNIRAHSYLKNECKKSIKLNFELGVIPVAILLLKLEMFCVAWKHHQHKYFTKFKCETFQISETSI